MQRRAFLSLTLPALSWWPLRGNGRPTLPFSPRRAGAAPEGFVLRAGHSRFGVPTPFHAINPNDLKVSARDTGGELALFDYQGVEPVGPSLHQHLTQDEIFYVVAGEFLFQLGEHKQLLHAGDTVFLPRQVAHTWVQRSPRGRLLCWVQPAGSLEEFFVFMSQQTTPLAPAQVQQVHARYGMERLGPGLSPTLDYALSPGFDAGFVTAAGRGRRGERTRLNGRNANELKIAGSDTGNTFSLFEYTGTERGGPPLHVHPHQDEVFYVLAGRYRFRVGAAEHELTAGDMIFLPRAVPHTFAQRTATGRLLFSFQPTGRMEAFFRALAALPTPPTPAAGAQLFAAHDMQVVGPPLPVDR